MARRMIRTARFFLRAWSPYRALHVCPRVEADVYLGRLGPVGITYEVETTWWWRGHVLRRHVEAVNV